MEKDHACDVIGWITTQKEPDQSSRGAGAQPFLFYFYPNTSTRPSLPSLVVNLMSRPFDQVSERHPTPPLSPSTSSGSSRGSSAPSLSPSPLSSLLPRDIDIDDDSHPGCPEPQPLPSKSTELGLMPHSHDDDAMMLDDDWEEVEHERLERDPGKRIQSIPLLAPLSATCGVVRM